MTEYRRQPFYVRMYRWCRCMPLACLRAIVELIGWALDGCPYRHPHMRKHRFKWGRREEARLIWSCHTACAHRDMGNVLPFSEYIESRRVK